MLKIERHNIIEQILIDRALPCSVTQRHFCCIEKTVRRDLHEMENEGITACTHGGTYIVEKFDKSYPANLRKSFFQNI